MKQYFVKNIYGKTTFLYIVLLFLIVFFCQEAKGQFPGVPVITTPKAATMQQYGSFSTPSLPRPNIPQPIYSPGISIQERNARMIEEDMRQVERQRQMQQRQIQEALEEFEPRQGLNMDVCRSVIPMPDFTSEQGTEYFFNAFDGIHQMLTGEAPVSLKVAIFLAENAYFGNRLSYADYNNHINQVAALCDLKIKQEGLDEKDPMIRKMMLFHFMSDTFQVRLPGSEKTLTHLPITYDYNDFEGREDLSNMFVTKVMAKNSGQCHSLALYYMVMAEAMGIEAYLSTAPMHNFVKIKDNKGKWHNLELTCGAILTDHHHIQAGFIKSEALRNKIYLEPMTQQQLIADVLLDVASKYIRNHGFDKFVVECYTTALKYHPNSVRAHIFRYDYYLALALYVFERAGITSQEQVALCPQA
ncbi:MAG: hypothetical protein LBQ60_10300, partial [Bacteroidales bacterium]|nr:hypothetical protein [Bacteroidales bacterium]